MASVNSPVRRFVKPIIHALFGDRAYEWFHYRGKLRDIKNRLVEEDEMELLPHFVKAGDDVIDVGANFAYYTTRLAALCPGGRVHAFEPIPSTFRTLRRIVKHFGLKNVDLHQAGVGEADAMLTFEVPLQELGTPSAGQAHLGGRDNRSLEAQGQYPFQRQQKVTCEVVALDQGRWKFPNLSFVKIDIEGAELYALRGMDRLLKAQRPVVLIEVCPSFLRGFGISEGQLRDQVEQMGYEFFRYRKAAKRLEKIRSKEFEEGNYLLIHREREAEFSDLLRSKDGTKN